MADADRAGQSRLIDPVTEAQAEPLAWALKDSGYAAWHSQPARTVRAADALALLHERFPTDLIAALTDWLAGIQALIEARMDEALTALRRASERFERLGREHEAALVQVPQLMALGMLGRIEDALTVGRAVRHALRTSGDGLAAARVEVNLGHLYARQDDYAQAQRMYRSALETFTAEDQRALQITALIGLANCATWQYDFATAERMHQQALVATQAAGLEALRANVLVNIGRLALNRGQLERAVDHFEQARRAYVALDMEVDAAQCAQQLGDAYLDLNLASEAAHIYRQVIALFDDHGLAFESAWTRAHLGRAQTRLGETDLAEQSFALAAAALDALDSPLSAAMTRVYAAQLALTQERWDQALALTRQADAVLQPANSITWSLTARWVQADVVRQAGEWDRAQRQFETVLTVARDQALAPLVWRAATSLGEVALARGDSGGAETWFREAVAVAEALRDSLPLEAFRIGFAADKVDAYRHLSALCLGATVARVQEAWQWAERGRARILADLVRSQLADTQANASDPVGQRERDELQASLNWLYSRLHGDQGEPLRSAQRERMMAAVRAREQALAELDRRRQPQGGDRDPQEEQGGALAGPDVLPAVPVLDAQTAVLHYTLTGDDLVVFVLTDQGVEAALTLGPMAQVETLAGQIRFQIESLRHGRERLRAHGAQLLTRVRHYLSQLERLIIAPVREIAARPQWVVVPHDALHGVPFQALFDATTGRYLLEDVTLTYAPSVSLLPEPLKPGWLTARVVLVGVPDERAPWVLGEIEALAPLFAQPATLIGAQATRAAVGAAGAPAAVLHLACHGVFRHDNPLFSALRLGDGWLTARDVYRLRLGAPLVTLSACETGLSAIAPGDEMLGLVRGFMAAGAANLLVSLWAVDDRATFDLMRAFYTRLTAGHSPAAALRAAQRELIAAQEHPYFWAPFVLYGRQ